MFIDLICCNCSIKRLFLALFVVYGVNGRNVEENNGNDDVVPLIVGGNNAVAGEFLGKVSVNLNINNRS